MSSKDSLRSRAVSVKVEQTVNEGSKPHPVSKPELVIPAVVPKTSQNSALAGNGAKVSNSSRAQSSPSHIKNVVKVEGDKSIGNSSLRETSNTPDRGTKRKLGRIPVGQILSLCLFQFSAADSFVLWLLCTSGSSFNNSFAVPAKILTLYSRTAVQGA